MHNQRMGSLYRQKRQRYGNSLMLTMRVNGASTIVGLVGCLGSDLLAAIHNQRIGSLHGQKKKRHGHSTILKMIVNRASMILVLHLV